MKRVWRAVVDSCPEGSRTCTEGRTIVHVRGFSEGAVRAADVMMVSTDNDGSLSNRSNIRRSWRLSENLMPCRLRLTQRNVSPYWNSPIGNSLVDGQSDADSSFLVRVKDPGLGSHNLKTNMQGTSSFFNLTSLIAGIKGNLALPTIILGMNCRYHSELAKLMLRRGVLGGSELNCTCIYYNIGNNRLSRPE